MEARVSEIADGVYRISAYVPDIAPPAGFTFNHFLVLGDEPLLFHTGLRRMFPVVRAAVETVLPAEKLRWICFGHYEADECGSMNEWLAVAASIGRLFDRSRDQRRVHERAALDDEAERIELTVRLKKQRRRKTKLVDRLAKAPDRGVIRRLGLQRQAVRHGGTTTGRAPPPRRPDRALCVFYR